MPAERINLQPDPRILLAITRNPMRPLDALCELIDNSIDSFASSEFRQQGSENNIAGHFLQSYRGPNP